MRCFSTWASICILHVRARRSMLNRRTVQVPAPSCCSLRLVKWTHALAAALVRRQEAGRGRAQGPASRFEPATWLTRRPVLPAQIPLAEEAQASLRARAPLPPSVHLIGRRPGGGDRPAGAPRGGCGVLGLLTRAVPRKEGSSLLENLAPHRTSATACGSSAKCDLRLHRGRQEMATACSLRRQHAAPNAGHPDWRWPRQHVEEATARLAEERRPQHVLRPESTLRPAPRIGDRPDAATCPRTKGRGSGRRARREASQPQPRASRARSCLQHAPLAFFGCPVCSSWR